MVVKEGGYDLWELKREGNGRKRDGMGLNVGVGILNVDFFKTPQAGRVGYGSLMTR